MLKLPIIEKGTSGNLRFRSHSTRSTQKSLIIFSLIITIALTFLGIRLFQLTIVKGSYYYRLAEENRIRELVIEAKRGTLLDRNGVVIASNKPADVHGLLPRLTSERSYSLESEIGQVVGYRQIADPQDVAADNCINKLTSGDKVGKKGMEKLFDCELRGKNGKKLIELDARGKQLEAISVIPPQDGEAVHTSIDLHLQQKAYELLKDKRAAMIGTNPNTGEVLFMVSTPSFSPADFEQMKNGNINSYLHDSNKPLLNRATVGTYPPGSVFKMVLAAGALEENLITPEKTIEDTGILKAGAASFGNWYYLQYGKKEGPVNMIKSLQRSNDIYYYKLGELLTPEKIKKWADVFGYGKKMNVGLEEEAGTLPSPFWKEETLHEKWYLGDTYNYSIGQGYLLTTPLQVQQTTSVFANGGYYCTPTFVKETDAQKQTKPQHNLQCKKLPLKETTIATIREGMHRACQTGGTGWPLFTFRPQVGCKTGTAESHAKSGVPHAWFTVFAPFDKPRIAVTVLIEEGGQGSDVAAPIAKEMLAEYFK